MDVFIDCYCYSKFERLVIKGKAKKESIETAWDDLFTEYCDLIGNKQNLEAAANWSYLEGKLRTLQHCLYLLNITYSAKCVEVIHSFGYRRKFNYQDQESYRADIRAVGLGLGSVKIAIKLAAQEYKDQQVTGKKLTEDDIMELLSVLGKQNNHPMHVNTTTVAEFAYAYKIFKKEIDQNSKP
jgi:hypothetical protein